MGDVMNFDIEQIKPETKFLIVRYDSKLFQSSQQRDSFYKELELLAKESGLKVVALESAVSLEQLSEKDLLNLLCVKAKDSNHGSITGLSTAGVANVPTQGTWLIDSDEVVISQKQNIQLNDYLNGMPKTGHTFDIRHELDLKGEHDDSEEHY